MSRPIPLLLPLLLSLLLGACPRAETSGTQEEPAERPILPALVRDFDSIDPAHHTYLVAPPRGGLLLVDIERVFDTSSVQQLRTLWGTQRVVEFSDVTLAHPRLSPVAAWVFGPNLSSGSETIEAVLFRGFVNAPSAPSPAELLVILGPRWPLPWDLCGPRDGLGVDRAPSLVAHNPDSGAKLGLTRVGEGAEVLWTVDHAGFLSTELDLGAWWAEKGYGECAALGSITVEGQFRPIGE